MTFVLSRQVQSQIDKFSDELYKLTSLDFNWDGEQSSRIHIPTIHSAEMLFDKIYPKICDLIPEIPWVVPISGGTLQLEWHKPDIELEFMDDENVCILWVPKGEVGWFGWKTEKCEVINIDGIVGFLRKVAEEYG